MPFPLTTEAGGGAKSRAFMKDALTGGEAEGEDKGLQDRSSPRGLRSRWGGGGVRQRPEWSAVGVARRVELGGGGLGRAGLS